MGEFSAEVQKSELEEQLKPILTTPGKRDRAP